MECPRLPPGLPPLTPSSSPPPPAAGIKNDKTGTTFTASMHIFCAVVGAGVLSLPKVLAWLGW